MPQTAEQAWNTAYQRVHVPVFFTKLAQDYNIEPKTQAEAEGLLAMGAKLRTLYEARQKQAAAQSQSHLARANSKLDGLLQAQGLIDNTATAPSTVVKQAAAEAAQDPELAAAFLTLLQAQKAG